VLTFWSRWLVYKIVDILRHRSIEQPTVIAAGIITASLVIISVLSAFPWVRKSVPHPPQPRRVCLVADGSFLACSKHHNVFERQHRFVGWLGLAVRALVTNACMPGTAS
jgi:hypothetical protein